MDPLDELLAERVEREAFTPIDTTTIAAWCTTFPGAASSGSSDAGSVVDRVPPAMVTTFLRPPDPSPPGAPIATNVALHERLKRALSLPVGIATDYRLQCGVGLHAGDRLQSVERIAHIAAERDTRVGRGRDWVIEVVSSVIDGPRAGAMACTEHWTMTGYDPARPATGSPNTPSDTAASDTAAPETSAPDAARPDGVPPESEGRWTSGIDISGAFIVDGATVNRVWAPAHHDDDAARAAGLSGIILDTSSWVALVVGHALVPFPGARLASVELSMRRPVGADTRLELEAVVVADVVGAADVRWVTVEVVGRVDGRISAIAEIRLAVATADGTDPFDLVGERWSPTTP